jgi:hypothetical protein
MKPKARENRGEVISRTGTGRLNNVLACVALHDYSYCTRVCQATSPHLFSSFKIPLPVSFRQQLRNSSVPDVKVVVFPYSRFVLNVQMIESKSVLRNNSLKFSNAVFSQTYISLSANIATTQSEFW